MILPDSSVWVAHLRRPEPELQSLLDAGLVAGHPYVTLEVALGSIARRRQVLDDLRGLPQLEVIDLTTIADFIEAHPLWSRGIGFADASLLVVTCRVPGARLWSRDKSLRRLAVELSVDAGLD